MTQPPEPARIFTAQTLQEGAEVELEESAARHVAGALRLKSGTALTLFNGQGGQYDAQITAVDRRRVIVAVKAFQPVERESGLSVTMGLGMSRGERMDYAIQKCTELGVTAMVPLLTERTEVRLRGDRADKKLRHWRQVAISACEQCGRNRVPDIATPMSLADWLEQTRGECRLVLHHRSDSGIDTSQAPGSVDLLIGPEGGLAPAEVEAALDAGFNALALGPRVMRTETAPVAALSIIQFHWGDLR